MTFLNWLCYIEFCSDIKIAEKLHIGMYIVDLNNLNRNTYIKNRIDNYRNNK